jgi:hypothetical protein
MKLRLEARVSSGTKVEAAHRRADKFDKRRQLKDAWAVFCSQPSVQRGEVVLLHG